MKTALGICAFLLASSASAGFFIDAPHLLPISGHDFDFDVLYPSGLSFSTSNPPTEPLSLEEIQSNSSLPQITLRNFGNSSNNEHYLSFALVTYVRPEVNSSYINSAPYIAWIRANQTLSDNGTLSGGGSGRDNGRTPQEAIVGDYKNATMHVWQQTQNVTDYLFKNNAAQSLWWMLWDLWSNSTAEGDPPPYVGYDFPRANIDFDVRNVTNTTTGNAESSTASHPMLSGPVMAAFCFIAMCAGL